MLNITNEQKETLKFYTTNDYLLINGLLWKEDKESIDELIRIINEDGRAVMNEALEIGFDVRWNCDKEKGKEIFKVYQKRFPVLDSEEVKKQIIDRAYQDIENMKKCLIPLENDYVLYRNIKSKYVCNITEGQIFKHLGFSSCSLNPHVAENANYGSSNCTLFEIVVPKNTPAIRLDLLKEVQNEDDEVILPPMEYMVTKVDKENNRIYMIFNQLL